MEKENKSNKIVIILLSVLIVLMIVGIIIGVIIITSSKNQNNISNANTVNENSEQNAIANNGSNTNEYSQNTVDMNINENTVNNLVNSIIENATNSVNNNVNENVVSSPTNNVNENTVNSSTNNVTNGSNQNNTVSGSVSTINSAIVNGVTISLPATKESFVGTGWEWDPKYANTDLATGYTASGGRMGKSPGGAVVSVVNKSGQTKKIQDCTIDYITFYNPKNGSENVTFIGGLNYNSTPAEVKSTFSKMGYKNLKERNYDSSNYYTYYLNDNTSNYRDYIEFYFYKNTLNSVTIRSSVK